MTDELNALKAALRAPAPDVDARAAAIKLAMENFDRLQGSADPMRPKQDRPLKAGVLQGIKSMLNTMKLKPVLIATTAACALLVGFVVVLPLDGQGPIEQAAGRPKAPASVEIPSPKQAQKKEVVVENTPAPTLDKVAPNLAVPLSEPACEGVCITGSARMGVVGDSADAGATSRLSAESVAPAEESTLFADAPAPTADLERDQALVSGIIEQMPEGLAIGQPVENTEAFANAPANPVKITAEEPVSTFSIDVDTASYATVRSSLNAGVLPDPASVRVEEMVNYFPYAYAKPEADQPFHPTITVMQTPWNPNTRLVNIAIQGAAPQVENRPPLNLVFLVDTSGSMDEPNKLPLLKQSLALMLGQLSPQDQVAIVAYAGSAGQVLPPTRATDQRAILAALDQLAAGGSTAGAQGLELAYQVAESMAEKGEVSRVLLATDGDFNVGIDDPEALKTYIAIKRETGVNLSVLGFGRGNLDDATMQALAQNGNGTAAYIDTLNEARKVLVDQLTGALYPIADNVKIQVEWNPAQVAEYRLIGYETRSLRREDFNNDKVDAGDIGAGTAVTAIYEVTAPNSPALRSDPLRYGPTVAPSGSDELGFLRLRSVAPGALDSTLQETPILAVGAANDDARFAAAIVGFGQLMSGGTYLGDWGWDQAIELALASRGVDEFGYRIEAVNLMRTAKALSIR